MRRPRVSLGAAITTVSMTARVTTRLICRDSYRRFLDGPCLRCREMGLLRAPEVIMLAISRGLPRQLFIFAFDFFPTSRRFFPAISRLTGCCLPLWRSPPDTIRLITPHEYGSAAAANKDSASVAAAASLQRSRRRRKRGRRRIAAVGIPPSYRFCRSGAICHYETPRPAASIIKQLPSL